MLNAYSVVNTNDVGGGSLRQAILDANENPGSDIIRFESSANGALDLREALPLLTDDVELIGTGADKVTVRRSLDVTDAFRIFTVAKGVTAKISGMTISNGLSTQGGGVYNEGDLTLSYCTIKQNTASGIGPQTALRGGGILNAPGAKLSIDECKITANTVHGVAAQQSTGFMAGGGIHNMGRLSMTSSAVSDNSVIALDPPQGGNYRAEGGGIYSSAFDDLYGSLTIESCTISGNRVSISGTTGMTELAAAQGGGVAIYGQEGANNAMAWITNSTIAGNATINEVVSASGKQPESFGGGVTIKYLTLFLKGSTIAENTVSATDSDAHTLAGGLYVYPHPNEAITQLVIDHTIIAKNVASEGRDLCGPIVSLGRNLFGDGTGGTGFHANDKVGTSAAKIDPKLGKLQDNGGKTQTMALAWSSPARNAGDAVSTIGWDQRGAGFRRVAMGKLDIGAFEVQDFQR